MKNIKLPSEFEEKRVCGSCAKCCEGWLSLEVYGHQVYKGRPCFYLEKTCTIYENRPLRPCKLFECTWLEEKFLPVWMRPDLSGVIIFKKTFKNIVYFTVAETDKPISSKVLNYIIQYAFNNNLNLLYFVEGGENRFGSDEFIKASLKEDSLKEDYINFYKKET